jgi:hypothetical protein
VTERQRVSQWRIQESKRTSPVGKNIVQIFWWELQEMAEQNFAMPFNPVADLNYSFSRSLNS